MKYHHLPVLLSVLFFTTVLSSCDSQHQVSTPQSVNVVIAPPTAVLAEAELVIQGGILLDMVADEANPVPIKGIVVRDGKIDRIIPADSADSLPPAHKIVNAASGYILPGLIDAHVHFRPWTPEATLWRRGNLYYGVTTIFDTGPCSTGCVETGRDPDEWITAYKDFMDASTGPTLYVTGRRLDGPVSGHPLSLVAQNPDDIIMHMDYLVDLGVDGFKVESTLSAELRKIVVEEAAHRGLPVVGHSTDALESIAAGMKFIEHMWPITSSIASSDPGVPFNSPNHDYLMDLEKAPELINLMIEQQVYLNPTMMGRYAHVSERRDSFAEEDEMLLSFGYVYSDLPEQLKPDTLTWIRRADRLDQNEKQKLVDGLDKVNTFLKLFSDAGGKVLAATDVNPPRLPGVTMHRELQLLVDAGISPYRALLGATRWASEMMFKNDLIGTIEQGKQADIIILGSNPTEDISNSRDISYVIRKGVVRKSPDDCSVIFPPIAQTCKQ